MNRFKWVLAIGLGLIATLNSCKEDTGSVGANVLPKGDLISEFQEDTTTIVTSMYLKDSALTNNAQNSMIGSYVDPVFGQFKASIYALVSSPFGATSFIPWDTGTVDSAEVVLLYLYQSTTTYYGNSDPQTFEIDTLSQVLNFNHEYFSDTTLKYGPTPVGTKLVTPNPNINDTLRIRLKQSWVNYLVGKMKNHPSYYYTSFDSLVKGLYMTVNNPFQLPGQGAIIYVGLDGANACINFYYHNPSTPTTRLNVPFPIAGNPSMYFNHIDKNYSTAPFYNKHPQGKHDSISANDLVYVQSGGGVLGRINFPYLKNWSKLSPVVINNATLTIIADAQENPNPFSPPTYVTLYGTDSLGAPYGIPDPSSGAPGQATLDQSNNVYSFNITYYIQHVIDGKIKDRGLYIIPNYFSETANRMVLFGARNGILPTTSPRMKLDIYYTPIKH